MGDKDDEVHSSYDDGEAHDDEGDGIIDLDSLSKKEWTDIEQLQAELDRIGGIKDDQENLEASLNYQRLISGEGD